ncbi:hypothetical protein Cgig2_015888 [Carnegiea gigantea]|uniref:DUF4283 domain-containing protein n=1 Tax=Carnegiea gigantea TaxID=171969 RepID=A0A9Q1GR25_9CARY|nr:hypothetical protein Cgig2_015888 [Carnegiea gigantea]
MVDPNDGMDLKFIPTHVITGVRYAKLEKDDVAAKATLDIDKIIFVRKCVFLVYFGKMQDKQKMKKRGVYYFDSKPFLVKGWNPEMDMHAEALPLWVQLLDWDVKHWGAESLSKIGSILRIPIKTDRYTKEKTMLRYARLLIDISLDSTFLDFIKFFNDNEVVYEWKPVKCAHRHMFGHEEQIYKKKGGLRQEWRRNNKVGMIGLLETKEKESNVDKSLWSDLQTRTQHIPEAWCIIGDFNSILYKEDRMGGTEVQDHEAQDLTNLLDNYDL